MKISILMLTYNAYKYVFNSIWTLRKTNKKIKYELIVVDNASRWPTKIVLAFLRLIGSIDKLYYNGYNSLFAKGNNIASGLADKDSTHYLLLNSDVEIKDPDWLYKLSSLHTSPGISSLGCVKRNPIRADGYCLLVDKWIYDKYRLDENYEWWWAVTKLESEVLKEGMQIRAVENHENLLHHFGGASGKGWVDAKGMDTNIKDVLTWFDGKKNDVTIIDSLP